MSVIIPHIVEPHPVTGVSNAKLGIWLFLASEIMLFGALFSSYVLLRVGTLEGAWPTGQEAGLDVVIGTFNTLVLILSSVTMVMAWASLKMDNFGDLTSNWESPLQWGFKKYMWITIGLACLFLVVKGFEWNAKFGHDIYPSTGTTPATAEAGPSVFYALYFTLTGLHAVHIIAGIIVLVWLATGGTHLWKSDSLRFSGRIECVGLYWHFVDLVWIFLFPIFYLL